MQRARGDLEGVLKAYQDSLAIREKLAAQDAGNAEWQRDLAVSHERLGDIDIDQGDDEAATAHFQRALEIRTEVVQREPSAGYWQRELIVPHWRLADLASRRSPASDEARTHYRAALEIAVALRDSGRQAPVDAWMVGELEPRLARVSQPAAR